jgi:hypothetical protein
MEGLYTLGELVKELGECTNNMKEEQRGKVLDFIDHLTWHFQTHDIVAYSNIRYQFNKLRRLEAYRG